MIETFKSAEFSECGKYRYILRRDWGFIEAPIAMCIGLNPSRADSVKDDPTIRILIDSLNHLGYRGLRMLNLYSLISPQPRKLFEVPDAIGLTDQWLQTTAHGCQEIIFCWGNFKGIDYRAKKVREMFPSAKCFGKNKDGSPLHPMGIMWQGIKKQDLKLIPYGKA